MPDRPTGLRPEDPGRADRAAAEEAHKVAPWRKWKSVPLRASSGGAYPYRVQFTVSGPDPMQNARYSRLIAAAAYKYFKIVEPPRDGKGPAAYLVEAFAEDEQSPAVELLRVVYDELIVQFKPNVSSGRRIELLEGTPFRVVKPSSLVKDQWIVRHAEGNAGESLLKEADKFAEVEEVQFAWPNSVAEYVRASNPNPLGRDWWLEHLQVNLPNGTRLPVGNSTVVIAVLDDGVDIAHPNLAGRVAAGFGRDFVFLPDEDDHFDPRPKVQVEDKAYSDYHGTACAGIVCSDGSQAGFRGVAPGCTLIPVRVFDGENLIGETRLANAIIYATDHADVISCSWGGLPYPAVENAIEDTVLGRDGRGSVFIASSGNEMKLTVAFPARHSPAIAVGACGPNNQLPPYANRGNELAVVAPSSFNNTKVYSTDVSQSGWGYNPGDPLDPVDPAGQFTNTFGGTSAAAAMAAGVAALCLSINPNLTAAEVRSILEETADPIPGGSQKFGHGRINAAAAYNEAEERLGAPS